MSMCCPFLKRYSWAVGYQEYAVHPDLQGAVKCFWSIVEPPSHEVQEVWPDACVELLFSLGNCFRVAEDGSSQPFPKVAVVGLQTGIMRVRTEGEVRLLGVRCYPFGLGSLETEELQSLSRQIEPDLRSGQLEPAVGRLEAWLLQQPRSQTGLEQILRQLYAANGSLSVAELARLQGASARQLEREFAAQLGVSPKQLARVVRFAAGWAALLQQPQASLAQLALELGYADQAHLNHEFKALGKQSPARFSRKYKP